MPKKTELFIQIGLIVLTLAGSVYVAVTPANSLLNWYNVDDAFFYYKVAQNILAGHGITFDQINLSNGFHPLWMVVCLGVFWLSDFHLLLPLRVLVLVSGLLNAATSLLLYRMIKRHLHPGAALVCALLWGLYPTIFGATTVLGMESSLSIFFIVLLLSTADKLFNQPQSKPNQWRGMIWLGFIGALTILARLDNLFVVGAIGIFVLLRIRKIPVIVLIDLLVIAVSVFTAWIIRLGSEGVVLHTYSIYPMLAVSLVIKPIFLYFGGCYFERAKMTWIKSGFRLALVWLGASVFEYLLMLLLFKLEITKMLSISIIILNSIIGFALVILVHSFLIKLQPTIHGNPFVVFWSWVKGYWRTTIIGGAAYAAPIAFLVGGYMIFNKITFGTFSPVSGQIKHWWSTLPNTVYARKISLLTVLGLSPSGANGPWALLTGKLNQAAKVISEVFNGLNINILFGILFILSMVIFLLIMRAEQGKLARRFFIMLIPAILAGCILHITYYFATGYTHTRGWYWMAEMLTLILCGSLVLDALFTWIDRQKIKIKFSTILTILFAIVIANSHIRYVTSLAPYIVPEENQANYITEVKEIEFYTKPGSKIGMTGGGLMSYFVQDRTVVNLDGLINSVEYYNAMKTGTATQFLDAIPLDYVFGKPYMLLESDPYGTILKDRLIEIGYIRGNEGFTLFKYFINQ